MVTTHKLGNIHVQKLKEINLEDGTKIIGGYKNIFYWEVTEMLPIEETPSAQDSTGRIKKIIRSVTKMLQTCIKLEDGEANGQFLEFKAKFKIDSKTNEIYAARDMEVFNRTHLDAGASDDRYCHTGTVSGKIYQLTLHDITYIIYSI